MKKSMRTLFLEAAERRAAGEKSSVDQILEQLGSREDSTTQKLLLRELVGEATAYESPTQQVYLSALRRGQASLDDILIDTRISSEKAISSLEDLVRDSALVRLSTAQGNMYTVNVFRDKFLFTREVFPSGPRIPLVYQYNLLCDRRRVLSFARALHTVLRPSDIVVDLGTGTGVLAVTAARLCRKVYAIEVDPAVYQFANEVIDNMGLSDKVSIILGDARSISLPEKADVAICEMIDTALIAELQVPVMNYSIKHLLKENFRAIPMSVETRIQLASVDYMFHSLEFRLPHFEAWGSRRYRTILSHEKPFHVADLRRLNSEKFDGIVSMRAEKTGTFNSLRIVSRTRLTRYISLGPSNWFIPPLILPLRSDVSVRRGQVVRAHLSYSLGGGLEGLRYSLEK